MLNRLVFCLLACGLFIVFGGAIGCDNAKPVPRRPVTAEVKTVAEGNGAFAFDLYAQLRSEQQGNLFFSPHSISTALATTYAGARGSTEAQMAGVLHFDLPQEKLHPAIGALASDLDATGKNRGYRLSIANRLWGRNDVVFLDPFLAVTRDSYGAELERLDFAAATEPSRKTINTWVEENTENKIRELLKPGIIDHTTVLVLTNAIYFQGDWAEQFDENRTKAEPFHLAADEAVDVPLMFQAGEFRFAETDDAQLLDLPYQGEDLSMLVVLPKGIDGLAAIESELNAEKLAAWQSKMKEREVYVWLPKFKMTSEFNLNDTLKAMGMPLPFTGDADFSGMNGSGGIYISAVVHKAFVEVNEKGTKAAAATAVVAKEAAFSAAQFRADHPFLFLIRDNHTGSILFIGRVMNPQG